jgi:hypothetical protein
LEFLTAPCSVLQLLVHSADLSNLCKRWDIHIQWSHSILAEFFSQVTTTSICLSRLNDIFHIIYLISFTNRGISRSIKAYQSLKSECEIFLLGGMCFFYLLDWDSKFMDLTNVQIRTNQKNFIGNVVLALYKLCGEALPSTKGVCDRSIEQMGKNHARWAALNY